MTELLTAAQMRAIEQATINSGKVTGLELMERAGAGVVEAVFEEWPELAEGAHKAVVLCGPGNNGGDGFVVARLLKDAGWEVEVFLYGDADKLPPDAKVNYKRWGEMGEVQTHSRSLKWLPDADIYFDCFFGTGLKRRLDEIVDQYRCEIIPDRGEKKLVSIDIPSGLCADSGSMFGGVCFEADLTVTFHRKKRGHILGNGPRMCGRLILKDIGLESNETQPIEPRRKWREPHFIGRGPVPLISLERWVFRILSKTSVRHKYTYGHALILSGPSGKGGAARLAARGALRISAGVVTLGCPGEALAENAARLDAIMLAAIHDGDALARVLQDSRINAVCVGPGLGLERAREMVRAILTGAGVKPRPTVLDADALSAYRDDPAELFEMLHENCVLTPHAGEFARLFPDIARRLSQEPTSGPAYSKVDATREAAKRAGCVVLFKGADTVIANPDGRCSVNSAAYERAAPWLATAGSGDVLAGFITGLLARNFGPMQAAETAAWLHVECALSFGPGLISEDLPEELPKVFRGLGV